MRQPDGGSITKLSGRTSEEDITDAPAESPVPVMFVEAVPPLAAPGEIDSSWDAWLSFFASPRLHGEPSLASTTMLPLLTSGTAGTRRSSGRFG